MLQHAAWEAALREDLALPGALADLFADVDDACDPDVSGLAAETAEDFVKYLGFFFESAGYEVHLEKMCQKMTRAMQVLLGYQQSSTARAMLIAVFSSVRMVPRL